MDTYKYKETFIEAAVDLIKSTEAIMPDESIQPFKIIMGTMFDILYDFAFSNQQTLTNLFNTYYDPKTAKIAGAFELSKVENPVLKGVLRLMLFATLTQIYAYGITTDPNSQITQGYL